jgi:hypothetical protein
MKIKELLPIGTIVLLNEGTKRMMIFGVKQTHIVGTSIEYDYIGVVYPEGFMGDKNQYLFNHEDIGTIIFIGFEDDERKEFIENLSKFYNET